MCSQKSQSENCSARSSQSNDVTDCVVPFETDSDGSDLRSVVVTGQAHGTRSHYQDFLVVSYLIINVSKFSLTPISRVLAVPRHYCIHTEN